MKNLREKETIGFHNNQLYKPLKETKKTERMQRYMKILPLVT